MRRYSFKDIGSKIQVQSTGLKIQIQLYRFKDTVSKIQVQRYRFKDAGSKIQV